MDLKKIGFVGLGAMGGPMVTRFLGAGFEVVVTDIDARAVNAMQQLGAISAADPCAVASECEVVLCSLPTPAVVESVVLGSRGVAQGSKVKIYVDLSTTGSVMAKRVAQGLAQTGKIAVDAPVSGGPAGVQAGSLAIMASGDRSAFETVEPILKAIATNIFYLGVEVGLGQTAKLANNLLAATTVAATCEVLAFGMRSGLDPSVLLKIINASSGRSFSSEFALPRGVESGNFNIGFRTELMHKDVKLCVSESEAVGVPMWIGANIAQFYTHAMSQGYAKQDVTSLAHVFSDWAKVKYPFVASS